MGEKKPKTLRLPLTREEFDDALSSAALSKLRSHKNGLAAAMVYCNATGRPLPEWARDRLAARQLLTDFNARRRRQKKMRHQMATFVKDLLRYESVLCLDDARGRWGNDKMERAFEEIQGLWFAPRESGGLKKSYYKFQRMFGGRVLSRHVAGSVAASRKNH